MVNFDFDHFVSILNSLSDLQAHNIFYGDGRRISDITMVFDNEIDENRNNAQARIQALRAASCVKILGKGVIRVVRRVDDAKENNNLGKIFMEWAQSASYDFAWLECIAEIEWVFV